ncbi:hypothetical protein ACODT5_22330 [Streptomyces sp. 5.8]|uniref:COG4315 family predicted lipoprotein n=1 Tax=Streptomyces sp. 5.8 TaxID=3406571 RepID=UPI003BB4BE9B
MKRTGVAIKWMTAAVLLAAVGSGCSSSSSKSSSAGPYSSTSVPASSTPSSGTTATVSVANSKFGGILVGADGRTLYLFEADASATSTCNGACAAAWPPLTATGAPQAGQGATAGLLSTSKRADDTMQVTYKGHPLYYYAGDAKAGDTSGEELSQFGAKWYVLNAAGDKVEGD